MAGTLLGTAAAGLAAAIALAGHSLGSSPGSGPVSPFGGSEPVHIARVGHIEVDLERGSGSGLRRVACAAPGGERCFVAP